MDREKFFEALKKLEQEDPTVRRVPVGLVVRENYDLIVEAKELGYQIEAIQKALEVQGTTATFKIALAKERKERQDEDGENSEDAEEGVAEAEKAAG